MKFVTSVPGSFLQLRNNLNARRSISNHCDSFVAIVVVMLPFRRVSDVTFKVMQAGNVWPLRVPEQLC